MSNRATLRLPLTILYFAFLLVPLYVLNKNSSFQNLGNPAVLTYTFLRLSGLYAFFLIFLQILWGAFMPFWKTIFDDRAVVWHEKMGVLAYILIFVHPVFFFISAYLASGLSVALGLILPGFSTDYDLHLTYGKIGFTLISLSVAAAYFRHLPFFNRYWLAFHLLNYVSFWFIFLHSRSVGSDTHTFPLNFLHPLMGAVVAASIAYRLAPRLMRRKHVSPATSKK